MEYGPVFDPADVQTSIDGCGYRNHSTSKCGELVFVSLFREFSLSSDQLE